MLLILALLAALTAPAGGVWACPDGTPCAPTRQGFACVGGQCATAASCCRVKSVHLCRHGAVPGVSGPHANEVRVAAPEHCRFTVVSRTAPTATTVGGKLTVPAPDVALVSTILPCRIPAVRPTWLAAPTLGYRPPPLLPAGPSRAPPLA
jgi:hypothetical protein